MATPLEALAGVPNATDPFPNLVTGGQPGVTHLKALKAAGVEIVLDIRDPMEPRPFDEAVEVRALGMEYVNVPVTAVSLDDATMERILSVVRGNANRSMLFHCASGNRVGGALLPLLIADRGLSQDDAIAAAMRVGLRGAEYLQWGVDYAERHPA